LIVAEIEMSGSYSDAADAWDAPDEGMYHTGRRDQAVMRTLSKVRLAALSGKPAIQKIGGELFKWVSDTRMLRAAWDFLARKGKRAPGPNGHRYEDFEDHEIWSLLKAISNQIRGGHYRTGPIRTIAIPKDRSDPSRGTRTLSLLNIEDRVVQRAIVEVSQALLDPLFGDRVLGFRRGRDRVDALDRAYRLASDSDRFVWITEDIRNAFDNVPRDQLMDIVAKYIPSPDLVELIERVVQYDKRKHGIPQGGPLSPLLLNLYVYHFVERQWPKQALRDVPTIRVADDMLLPCESGNEAVAAWHKLNELLAKAGMTLKHGIDKSVVTLSRGKPAEWLGFRIRRGQSGFETKIAKQSWRKLRQRLELAHEKPDSPLRAVDAINGWIDQLGPCYAHVNRSRECRNIRKVASQNGFDESPRLTALRFRWLQSHLRWQRRRECGPKTSDGKAAASHNATMSDDPFPEIPTTGICIYPTWSRERHNMEHLGIQLHDGTEAYQSRDYLTGSNNLGEFLAIVRGLRYLQRKGLDGPIYSHNAAVIKWVHDRRLRSRTANRGKVGDEVYLALTRALLWLDRHRPTIPVLRWNTSEWGEMPAVMQQT